MAPVIGITAAIDQKVDKYLLSFAYVQAVEAAGGLPLIIPCLGNPGAVLDLVDGLVLTGGDDIDAHLFHQDPVPEQGWVDPRRDRSELSLIEGALARGIPLLGICYGFQMINIALGGNLHQDIKRSGFTGLQHAQRSHRWVPGHKVQIVTGSRLHRLAGREEIRVNSFHHQAVAQLGAGLKAVAFSSDGLTEAIEADEGFVLGVQWHPETLNDEISTALFSALVQAAR